MLHPKGRFFILKMKTKATLLILIKKLLMKYKASIIKFIKENGFNSSRLQFRHSTLLLIILNKLNIDLNNISNSDHSTLYKLSTVYLVFALMTLFNFISIIGALTAIILKYKYDVETKFPKLKKIIRYYENTSLIYITIEIIMALFCLFVIIIACSIIIFND